jgi:hypothetical protein
MFLFILAAPPRSGRRSAAPLLVYDYCDRRFSSVKAVAHAGPIGLA